MHTYVALLRAVNVGGTGKLPMRELTALCEAVGLAQVRTYIQSGNVVFASALPEPRARRLLADALAAKMGKPVGVVVRTAAEMAAVVAANPFPEAPPTKVQILFVPEAPPADWLAAVRRRTSEELVPRGRELFVHYPDGVGKSKLVIPQQELGTMRNLNTVRHLAELAA